jgi:hypothetical protein
MAQWSANNCGSRHESMILYFYPVQAREQSGTRSPRVTMDDTSIV